MTNELFRFVQLRPLVETERRAPGGDADRPAPTPEETDAKAITVLAPMAAQLEETAEKDHAAALQEATDYLSLRDDLTKLGVAAASFARFLGTRRDLFIGEIKDLVRQRVPEDKINDTRLSQLEDRYANGLFCLRFAMPQNAQAEAMMVNAIRAIVIVEGVRKDSLSAAEVYGLLQAPVYVSATGDARKINDPPLRAVVSPMTAIGEKERMQITRGGGVLSPAHRVPGRVGKVGSVAVEAYRPYQGGLIPLNKPGAPSDVLVSPPTGGVPTLPGEVRIAGIAELIVGEETLVGYDEGEIAHIENVMQTEIREREHTRTATTDNYSSIVTDESEETETSLQTTERFELQREISEYVQTELSASLAASASYRGPMIEGSVTANASASTVRQRSEEQAQSFAREVTTRAAARIQKRVTTTLTQRKTLVIEERNLHGFDNKAGTNHAVGIYRFLDKKTSVQLSNYGLRLMLDLVLPEPATSYVQTQSQSVPTGLTISKPDEFTLDPLEIEHFDDADPNFYMKVAAKYGVYDLPPPPPRQTKVVIPVSIPAADAVNTDDADEEDMPDQEKYEHFSQEVIFPDGYKPVKANVAVAFSRPLSSQGYWSERIELLIANERRGFQNLRNMIEAEINLDEWQADGPLPLVYSVINRRGSTMSITFTCERRANTLNAWKLQIWGMIDAAFRAQMQAYREELSYHSTQDFGVNPAINRQIERQEVKRGTLSVLTGQEFDDFGAITIFADTPPRIDFDEIRDEGAYIQFLEDAFEWEHMNYEFFDYIWAGRHRWSDLLNRSSIDPLHEEFLRSGASRVRLSVRPGYEAAVIHFLDTGLIDPSVELKDDHRWKTEIVDMGPPETRDEKSKFGEPFDVVTPTNLVILQRGPDPDVIEQVTAIETPDRTGS